MSSLLILGGGQYGRLTAEIAAEQYDRICFLDDGLPLSQTVLGRFSDCEKISAEFDAVIVAIGNAETRRRYAEMLPNLVSLISSRAYVSPSAAVGPGCIIEPLVSVGAGTVLGKGCILSSGAVLNHDSVVGDYCHINCNATVAARSAVPPGTKVPYGQIWQAEPKE